MKSRIKKKEIGHCHICGKYGELSFEHIPLNEELQVIKNARMWAFDDMDFFYDEWYVKRENNETV